MRADSERLISVHTARGEGYDLRIAACRDGSRETDPVTTDQRNVGKEAAVARIHQPDQSAFRSILPEDIDWKPFPAFPPGARLAVLVGHPAEAGPYVVRVKVPDGTKLMPHKHPEDRIYTVMSGFFTSGSGRPSMATR